MSLEDDIRQLRKDMPRIRTYLGSYAGRVDGQPVVDISDESRISAALMFPDPVVGTAVRVWDLNGEWVIAGMVDQPVSEGVISVIGSERVTVITDRGEFTVPFLTSYTPSSGHTVQLGYNSQGLYVIDRLSEDVTPPAAPPAPVRAAQRPTDLFTATGSGSAAQGSSNWFTNQVYASASNIGIYVYGSKVRDTLAAAPPVKKLEVYLPAVQNRYGNMRLGWHPKETRTGSTPPITGLRTVGTGWVDITDLADDLKVGGGIGFDGAGYTIFTGVPMNGRAGDPQAGALRATY